MTRQASDTVARLGSRLPTLHAGRVRLRWLEEGDVPALHEIFTPEMLSGGYRKKYLRATSRLLALSRFEVAAG